jgi:isoleucyl-tRNA synthetase
MTDPKKANQNNPILAKSDIAKREEEVLRFWQENKIFEKTLGQTKNGQEYVFYDGPPFATGTPHYGHIAAGTIKDAIPRFQTMCGRFVRRRWGWDCHGLPVENIVEKELGLKSKKDIEEYGLEKFNWRAKEVVQEYVADWKQFIPRLGRFVDMEDDYRTMDWYYTESVMQVFKRLYDKGLIYEGYKSMQICPRCETTLSNFEVNLGYKDITDVTVTVKFRVKSQTTRDKLEPDTFILAWTTTPWTLPGNVALAVGPEIEYVKVKSKGQGVKLKAGESYILAKERAAEVLAGEDYEIVAEMKGNELIGLEYEPVFDYYAKDETLKYRENGWKIYGALFVTTEDGTGVVHIAPAFGEDDMNLGQKEKLPFVQHVSMDGRFKPEVKEWAGELVKPKSEPGLDDPDPTAEEEQAMDIKILKYLAANGTLFDKKKIVHSYPHCWRCHTPLLNYAASSWFVKVTDFKDTLVANNKMIGWVPEHIKEGRFGKWLEGARDWAISRSRYWGAPLPVWKCETCKKIKVAGSLLELKDNIGQRGNRFFLMRHGEAQSNLSDLIDCQPGSANNLTDKGRDQAAAAAETLRDKKIDLIVSSDLLRAKETAEIAAKVLAIPAEHLSLDPRLREYNVGDKNGGKWADYDGSFKSKREKLHYAGPGGESVLDVKKRMGELLYELNGKYAGKNILIVSHALPLFFAEVASHGFNERETELLRHWGSSYKNAEIKELKFQYLPHNENYELDLHRPYIDKLIFNCDCGGEMKRVPEVFDCWFESGSMPYGQAHYPFENSDKFDPEQGVGFPADFIAEGLDQTRGWFYSMLVLSTALFGKTSYKNVIVNGLVLAEDGQKMSKSLKNYPDPLGLIDKYGSDALRFYLLSSPVMRAEDLNFSEKGVGEVYRKIVMRLSNVYSFFEMYVDESKVKDQNANSEEESENILDRWIRARFGELVAKVTAAMEAYELDRAMRPIDDFIDDLSNWYLRRSRERFKSEDETDRLSAVRTTREILNSLAVVIAPFMPFVADEIYRKTGGEKESVHLASWPEVLAYDAPLIEDMAKARGFVEIGLGLRDKKGLKVRQPVSEFVIADEISEPLLNVIAEELNAKKVASGTLADLSIERYEICTNEKGEALAALNFAITPELKLEGEMRELVRMIQDLRKKEGLKPGELADFTVAQEFKEVLAKYESDIKIAVSARNLSLGSALTLMKLS